AWRDALYEHFRGHASSLSEDSQARLERNPLRILDSKAHQDWPIVDSAPAIDEFLTSEAGDFFGKVTEGLDAARIKWERAPRLVRGLDYYRHTAFEFVTDRLGAQGTVLAGGRYDGLIEALGGSHTPAVGWAAGIERLAMMIGAPERETPSVVIVPLGPRAELQGQSIVAGLRREGIAADMGYRGNMKKRLSRANDAGARYALIIGDDELERGEAQLKDLGSGEQRAVSLDLIAEAIGR
ncbi:MAG TPA: His/Gly/Thr/Pro-type tRNA ligase C-terminal domain-containing protein, partial [Sphingomicrobium sp.]